MISSFFVGNFVLSIIELIFSPIGFFALVYFIICFIFSRVKKHLKKSNEAYFKSNIVESSEIPEKKYTDISIEQLKEFNTEDLEAFKKFFYDLFVKFENAYNNLDYNMMKILSTNKMYENYYTGIKLDLEAGNKRIITNIQKKDIVIYEIFSSTAKQVVSAMIEISYIDYTIDKNGYIKKGSRDQKITEKFEVTFRKDFEKDEIIKCPNCGAAVVGNKCKYCRTSLKNVEFKISNIKKIIE